MLRKTFATVVAAGLALTSLAAAQSQGTFLTPSPDEPTTRIGTRGANFLEIGVGARGQAMGMALAGLAQGATAMYWNPAGISTTETITAAFSRSELYQDLGITHTFGAVALPLLGGALGISYIRLDSGEMPRTTEDRPDNPGRQFGESFTFAGTAVGLSYGRRLTDRLSVGGTAKSITEGMAGANADWWAVDLGTQFTTGLYGITIGAALTNIGSQARYEGPVIERFVTANEAFDVDLPLSLATVRHALPTAFHFSVVSSLAGTPDALFGASSAHRLTAVMELNDGVDTDIMTTLAAEYNFRNIAFLRVGKRYVNERETDFRSGSFGFSWGGGVKVPFLGRHISVDYAHTNMGELDNIQTWTFEIGN